MIHSQMSEAFIKWPSPVQLRFMRRNTDAYPDRLLDGNTHVPLDQDHPLGLMPIDRKAAFDAAVAPLDCDLVTCDGTDLFSVGRMHRKRLLRDAVLQQF